MDKAWEKTQKKTFTGKFIKTDITFLVYVTLIMIRFTICISSMIGNSQTPFSLQRGLTLT